MGGSVRSLIEVCAELARRRFAMVAIDGPTGSGKSILAERIKGEIGSGTVVHMDDFYRPMPEEDRARLSPAAGSEHLFDWERLRRDVLEPLREGRTASYLRYDWHRNELGKEEMIVEAHGLVLVEGVYGLRPELTLFWDLAIYLDVPVGVCIPRLIARGGRTHGSRSTAGRPARSTIV